MRYLAIVLMLVCTACGGMDPAFCHEDQVWLDGSCVHVCKAMEAITIDSYNRTCQGLEETCLFCQCWLKYHEFPAITGRECQPMDLDGCPAYLAMGGTYEALKVHIETFDWDEWVSNLREACVDGILFQRH